MNNKVSQKKYRRISIAAFILGILAFACALIFFTIIGPIFVKNIEKFLPGIFLVVFFESCFAICFAIPAIICGSIDFRKIKKGQYSDNGLLLDIFGMVLGVIFILFAFFLIFGCK
jgi:hypothetical protein